MRAVCFLALGIGFTVGCSGSVPTTSPQEERIYDVSWLVLCRDYPTASAYTNKRVRIRLDKDSFSIAGREIRVWANQPMDAPPILICVCHDTIPPGENLIVSGVCRGPTRDGVVRTRTADFYVVVDHCFVTAR